MSKSKFFIKIQNVVQDLVGHEDVMREVDGYSITPRTFESRTLLEDNNHLQRVKARLTEIHTKKSGLEEQKKAIEDAGLKFKTDLQKLGVGEGDVSGCMSKLEPSISEIISKYCQSKITILDSYAKQLEEYEAFLEAPENQSLLLFYHDVFNNGEVSTNRYGINVMEMEVQQAKSLGKIYCSVEKKTDGSQRSNSKKKDDANPVQLHPLEVFQVEDAILSLKDSDVSTSVLIDIFARNEDGSIKIKSSKLETHTIVLYKSGYGRFVVIDPSNSDFSKHICGNSEILLAVSGTEIFVPSNTIKIYVPASQDNVGPEQDQYRDCIDVAYKIAANLQKAQAGVLDLKQLRDHDVIKMISNNQEIDNSILTAVSRQSAVRIKQASERGIVESYYEIEKLLKKKHETALQSKYLEGKVTDMEELYVNALETHVDEALTPKYSLVLSALAKCNRSFFRTESEMLELLGVSGGDYE